MVTAKTTFFKTSGGGQYFQKIGDTLKVICLYDFNPCIERMKFTPDILQSLKCIECGEDEFREAERKVLLMLGTQPLPVTSLSTTSIRFGDAAPGLYYREDPFLITAYSNQRGERQAFLLETGETYWGGVSTVEERNELLVSPIVRISVA